MNIIFTQAEKWLNELGIRTMSQPTFLMVSRDDMVSLLDGVAESQYEEILQQLRKALNSNKLFWGGKDDNWLWLQSF